MENEAHILCVDDNRDTTELVTLMLRIEGHKTTAAKSVDEALALIERRSYDLYVLDVRLPQVDGLELCRKIRATDAQVPIILYSGGAYGIDESAGFDAGATRYLVKPEGIYVLANAVKSLLSQKKASTVTRSQSRSARG